jgi:hypothetical protein
VAIWKERCESEEVERRKTTNTNHTWHRDRDCRE